MVVVVVIKLIRRSLFDGRASMPRIFRREILIRLESGVQARFSLFSRDSAHNLYDITITIRSFLVFGHRGCEACVCKYDNNEESNPCIFFCFVPTIPCTSNRQAHTHTHTPNELM